MKRFNMIDEEFLCENCGKKVEKLNYTARDHCPFCLYSKHLDINPGDREAGCAGLLIPFDIEKNSEKYKIIYKCEKCGIIKKNKVASDDSFEEILKVMSKEK